MLTICIIVAWILVWGTAGFFIGRAIRSRIVIKKMVNEYWARQAEMMQRKTWVQKCAENNEDFRKAWNDVFPEQKVD